ncbi:MAG: hypothetical protein P9L89_01715 [Candidatus Celaenobacter polaris]|nr:hypothetical protein [Candidatus Celaenobacter polaris]
MTERFILIFDDNTDIIKNFNTAISQMDLSLSVKGCSDSKEFAKAIDDRNIIRKTRVIIVDLAQNKSEEDTHIFGIKNTIVNNFNKYRIPLFIHSAFADYFTDLDGKGTVFKIEKSGAAIKTICEKIKLFHESNFLEIFCSGGILENNYLEQLHKAFTEQFENNEIEEIITSIKETAGDKYQERTIEVFKRIAVRSLFHNLTAARKDKEGNLNEIPLNYVEHYYRRYSAYDVWTGDIFRKKEAEETILVMTPRCDINKSTCEQILACKIVPLEIKLTKKEKFQQAINDNAKLTSGSSRILTPSPLFNGGEIKYASPIIINRQSLIGDYELIVSLSDELINDVVRKFSAYILRSGVSETEMEEARKYTEIIKQGENDN